MGYTGENNIFSFRDGFCEVLPGKNITSADIAVLGRIIARFFRRFCAGCEGFKNMHILYALSCGISESGKDIYICENTDMQSFRFGVPMLSADCGIFISGDRSIKISFTGAEGFPIPTEIISQIISAEPTPTAEKFGRIISYTSFREIYVNNLADSFTGERRTISAGISCGNKAIRSLWLEFFSGESDELVFQVSDDGQRVNAYSAKTGFISHDKLTLAYAVRLSENGQAVFLPEDFHYIADESLKVKRFNPERHIPPAVREQRFLTDPLYMCLNLTARDFIRTIKSLPQIASARREIAINSLDGIPCGKIISEKNGRVVISRSGRNRISVLAQSLSAETASELCAHWCARLRSINPDS